MNIFTIKTLKYFQIILLFFAVCSFSDTVFSQEYKTVKAINGDGIYTLLKRHGIPAKEFNSFVEMNKYNLGKNNTLIVGQTYKLPVKLEPSTPAYNKTFVTEKLFGLKYQKVELVDKQLKGAIYYLESGHGGPDPGALGTLAGNFLCEDEYAYDVTLRLARNLISHSATVYLITRDPNDGIRDESFLKPDKDEVCYPKLQIPLRQTLRLKQRADAVNKLYMKNPKAFQRQIVIHVDSRSIRTNIDVFFYYDERSNTGKKLAENLMQTFNEKYQLRQPGRGYEGSVSERNLYVIKYSYTPAVFIELGNINHQRDQKRLIIPDNRQALANWLTDGLIKDFGNNK